jgi:hypothetical protein
MDKIKIRPNRGNFHLSMHSVNHIDPTVEGVKSFLRKYVCLGLKPEDYETITVEEYQPKGDFRNKWKVVYLVRGATGKVLAFTNGSLINES